MKREAGASASTDKAGAAPATVSEFKRFIRPLRRRAGRRTARSNPLTSPETGLQVVEHRCRRMLSERACSFRPASSSAHHPHQRARVRAITTGTAMSRPKQLLISALSAAGLSGALHADEAPVIVTATRTAQIADQALAPVIVIDRATIERSAAVDVADLLRFHAGIDIGRNGGPGQATSMFIRGTDSNHALVMIDGVKINPGTIGGAALQNISPEMIDHIEIVKGPRSSLYGSEAIGGVVNVITRRGGADGAQGNFAVGAGSYGTRTFSVGTHYGSDQLRVSFDANGFGTDGFPTRVDSDIANNQNHNNNSTYLGDRAGPLDWERGRWQAKGNTEYLSFFLSPLEQDFTNSATALTLKAAPRDARTSTLRIGSVVDEVNQNQSSDYSEAHRRQFDWQNDVQLDAHHLLLAARHTDHESFGGYTSWDAEYGYQLTASTRVTAAVGTAFRAPDATDRFGFGGNPALKPETARSAHALRRVRRCARQALALSA